MYQILVRSLGQFPPMKAIAKSLNMTSRTLHRHLEGEGLSFSEILDDVRRSLATEYLKTTCMNIDDIAMLVGFSDVANFRKAFKRCTGKNPGDVRRE